MNPPLAYRKASTPSFHAPTMVSACRSLYHPHFCPACSGCASLARLFCRAAWSPLSLRGARLDPIFAWASWLPLGNHLCPNTSFRSPSPDPAQNRCNYTPHRGAAPITGISRSSFPWPCPDSQVDSSVDGLWRSPGHSMMYSTPTAPAYAPCRAMSAALVPPLYLHFRGHLSNCCNTYVAESWTSDIVTRIAAARVRSSEGPGIPRCSSPSEPISWASRST